MAGDEFGYHFGDLHRCRIRVTEALPGRLAGEPLHRRYGVDRHHDELRDGDIEPRLTHHGPVPECYQRWGTYVGTGRGEPILVGERRPPPRPGGR